MKIREGFSKWVALKDLTESNPVELAEYAVANKIYHELAFAWWVLFVLRKRILLALPGCFPSGPSVLPTWRTLP